MCSSGGPMADIDLKKLKTKKYQMKYYFSKGKPEWSVL